MNKLNTIRKHMGLSCAGLGKMVNYDRSAVWKHCHADIIPAEAAFRYACALGIPLADLRPDLPLLVVTTETGDSQQRALSSPPAESIGVKESNNELA